MKEDLAKACHVDKVRLYYKNRNNGQLHLELAADQAVAGWSRDQVVDHMAVDVGQSEVAALVAVC